mmetsp:Transcript_16617/g.58167  ORF Transcript_16617/g.58167 Transcript_16617/m.58167 type:complete len:450 (+) Transcript_16617:108-1457(+)
MAVVEREAEKMEEAVDPMAGIEAPTARAPAPPTAANLGRLKGAPSFLGDAQELEELQAAGRELQELATSGKRLTHAALQRMHAADLEGARAHLQEVAALRPIREVMGEALWLDPGRRLKLCEGNQVAWFIESHLCCLSLMSFFERGVLSPEVPESCRIGIDDRDDEWYLLGILDAVRELERYAVNRGQALDLDSIRLCLEAVQCLQQALQQFDFRNSELRRRFDGVKYAVRKFEHLAYEVNLALQRAAATALAAAAANAAPTAAGAAGAESASDVASAAHVVTEVPAAVLASASSSAPALDLPALAAVKLRYDRFDETRENVLKKARDVIKSAKNAVYDLQRSKFGNADSNLAKCAKEASAIYAAHIAEYPSLRGGLFSASLEEMAEALSLRAFLKDRTILSRAEMQAQSGLSFPMGLHEYLGGLMDLTGEVGRLAIKVNSYQDRGCAL